MIRHAPVPVEATAPIGHAVFTSFLAFQAGAASLPAGVTEAASIEGITEYRLGNGLRVLLVPDESKPSTTVNMTYLVGSRNENYGQTGMAHLLEHMLFKGTSTTRNAMGEFAPRPAGQRLDLWRPHQLSPASPPTPRRSSGTWAGRLTPWSIR